MRFTPSPVRAESFGLPHPKGREPGGGGLFFARRLSAAEIEAYNRKPAGRVGA